MKVKIIKELKNCVLADDIYSERGVLLLSKGHKLTLEDINLLLDRNIDEVIIKKDLSKIDIVLSDLYSDGISKVEDIFNQAYSNEKIEIDLATKAIENIKEYISLNKGVLYHLITNTSIDDYTIQHSLNVAILSSILADIIGLSENEVMRIGHAGLLHDIGKALISKEILLKPSKLTIEEYNIIKEHSQYGYEILRKNNINDEYILSATLMHHERLNGIGYPKGLKRESISISAQIVAVTDIFDAITSKRVYKEPQLILDAYIELKNGAFNNELNALMVMKFLEKLSSIFEGKKVLLSDKSVGRLIRTNKNDYNRLVLEVDGRLFDPSKITDLSMLGFVD